MISIVGSLYKTSEYIPEFYEAIIKSIKNIKEDYEIILVSDGCPENSFEKAVNFYKDKSNIKILNLSKNFGHHAAMFCGVSYAKGDYTFLIDTDLEEDPNWLESFYHEIKNSKVELVFGYQKKRKGNFIEKISGNIFYKLCRLLSKNSIPDNLVTARLMTKKYTDELKKLNEITLDYHSIFHTLGFKNKGIEVEKKSNSTTTYTFWKKIELFFNILISISTYPLKFFFFLGLFISFSSLTVVSYYLVLYFFEKITVSGFATIILSIWFLGGIIILNLGIIGIYISKIFIEVKQRPRFIISDFFSDKN